MHKSAYELGFIVGYQKTAGMMPQAPGMPQQQMTQAQTIDPAQQAQDEANSAYQQKMQDIKNNAMMNIKKTGLKANYEKQVADLDHQAKTQNMSQNMSAQPQTPQPPQMQGMTGR